jgi:hypothetical protein
MERISQPEAVQRLMGIAALNHILQKPARPDLLGPPHPTKACDCQPISASPVGWR